MNQISSSLQTGSRTLTYLLGFLVLSLAIITALYGLKTKNTLDLMLATFGPVFIGLALILIFSTLYCWQKQSDFLYDPVKRRPWTRAAMHFADGISTLALTFTLLGISLGIGTLAEKPLTPDTIHIVIKDLTKHFSLAFMTTVFGLPASAVLRALVQITEAKIESATVEKSLFLEGKAR